MPIKGLSEKRRLPRLGKIHLGVKKENDKGVQYPSAVDYFVCPPEVQKLFGEQPRELRIMVPVEDEEKWASQYYRCYSMTRGLICKGDGETALRMVDTQTGALANKDTKEVAMRDMPCKGRECPDYKVMCKEVMNLQFLLPEVPGLGIWQIDTGSINSIQNINSAADLIKRLYGHIAMLPLLLTIESQEAKTPDGKKNTIWVLNLRTRETLSSLMGVSMKTVDQILLTEITEDDELPIGDDEVPTLIIPQAQDPAQNKPIAKPEVVKSETAHICPIHRVELRRFEKAGSVWYSHQLDDKSYCNGNAPAKPKPPIAATKQAEATPVPAQGQPQGAKATGLAIAEQLAEVLRLGKALGGFKDDDNIISSACLREKQDEWQNMTALNAAAVINAWSTALTARQAKPKGNTAQKFEDL